MLAKLILVTAATTGGGVLFWNGVPYSIENAKCCSFLPIKSRLFCHEFKHSLVYFLQGWIKLWCTKIVIIHCREEGCIGKYAPWGNLEGRGVQIAEGGVFFQFIPTRDSVLPFFFPEQECIGNYIPNSWLVLTVYGFNTPLLYKKRMEITAQLAG